MWVGLLLIVALVVLCVYGAFVGAVSAKAFFNSAVMQVFWVLLLFALVVAPFTFRGIGQRPSLALIHIGGILILAGSIWSSEPAHNIRSKLLGSGKLAAGRMVALKGETVNEVFYPDATLLRELPKEVDLNDLYVTLPFSLQLEDSGIEYYQPGHLWIESDRGRRFHLTAEPGASITLPRDLGTVQVVKTFENVKISLKDDKIVALDVPAEGFNPAVQIRISRPDGSVSTEYVFARFKDRRWQGPLSFIYRKDIRDYVAYVKVIRDQEVAKLKRIEVNKPLHYGGYYFCLSRLDDKLNAALLSVVSDSGLSTVFAGYFTLCVGLFWQLWLRNLFLRRKSKAE